MIPRISDKRRTLEIVAVVLTAAGKFIFMDWLEWRLAFILFTLAGWLLYIFWISRSNACVLNYYGFRTDNLVAALRTLLPFGLISVAACFITGYVSDTLNLTWHIFPILIVYPIWGTLQQFLCVGLVAGNMQDMTRPWNNGLITITTAILFSVLHYPDVWLIAGTFALALLYTALYLKQRNVYALGIFHGWLGAIFYYTVVGRDPFEEVFGPILK